MTCRVQKHDPVRLVDSVDPIRKGLAELAVGVSPVRLYNCYPQSLLWTFRGWIGISPGSIDGGLPSAIYFAAADLPAVAGGGDPLTSQTSILPAVRSRCMPMANRLLPSTFQSSSRITSALG